MRLLLVVISLLAWVAVLPAAEVVKAVRVSGLGAIIDGDLEGGFEQARKAAMRQAVEEGVGVLITAQTRVQNYALIEDDILTRTEGYIRHYEIVDHGPVGDSTYQVTIEAVVSLGDLHRQLESLELLIESAGNPYILCLGRERLREDGQLQEAGWGVVANQLQQALQQASRRFNLVAPDSGSEKRVFADLEAAARLGQRQGADIVIRGDAVVQAAEGIRIPFSGTTLEESGIRSVAAELRLEALWSDTGELFATLAATQRAAATTLQGAGEKAIRTGMEKLAGELLEKLAEDWREKVYSGRLIRLTVQADQDQVVDFEREFPLRISGIEKLYPRGQTPEQAVYDVRAKGSGFEVARQLAGRGLGEEMEVEILQVSPNTLKLQLIPRKGLHAPHPGDRTE